MKTLNKIAIWVFIIISLLPIFEFFVFQWRNENRVNIDTATQIVDINVQTNNPYIVIKLPTEINSFYDYVIKNNYFGTVTSVDGIPTNVQLGGIQQLISINAIKIIKNVASNSMKGNLFISIISLSMLLERTIYIAISVFLCYILFLPIFFLKGWFTKNEK